MTSASSTPRRKEVEGLNPVVLRWARERSGRSVEDVAERLGKNPAVVASWELGDGAPTYSELERLAYEVLKRPLAMFFFPAPPEEPALEEWFRTLPGFEIEKLTPATRHAIRRARADQIALAELFHGKSAAARLLVRDVRITPGGDVAEAAAALRRVLGVSIEDQTVRRKANGRPSRAGGARSRTRVSSSSRTPSSRNRSPASVSTMRPFPWWF